MRVGVDGRTEAARLPGASLTPVLYVVLCALACRGGGAESAQSGQVAVADRANVTLDSLIDRLRYVEGTFVNPVAGRWDFTGDRSALVAFERFGDTAVARLVDCLDRPEFAAATVRARRVHMGYMCYAALARVAYYEWHQHQDVEKTPSWAGEVPATASADELRRAKAAWLIVANKRLYFLH